MGRHDAESFNGVDVAIEFSTPEAAPANLKRLAASQCSLP